MVLYERELEFALKASQAAADLLRAGFHEGFPEHLDKSADVCINQILSPAFPNYGYHSEELGLQALPRDSERHLWLVDPQDGTSAAHRGYRSAAISVALLRDGLPVLGVVYAYCAPDDAGDLFWWVEGHGSLRRNGKEVTRNWPKKLSRHCTVLISQEADFQPHTNAELVAPMRFRGVVGIAYRLALVAAGEGDVGVSLNSPTGWDVAGGHALLRGAGGRLFDQDGRPVAYDSEGWPVRAIHFCFGGSETLAQALSGRHWGRIFEHPPGPSAAASLAFLERGHAVRDAGMLARAQGCLLGQLAGDALGSLVEFEGPRDIVRRFPQGPRLLEDGGCWDTIAGQPTDDSELALSLARSIVQAGGYEEEAVGRSYARWKDSHPFDIGHATRTALTSASRALRENRPVAEAAREAALRDTQANGALMRISPLGIFGTSLPSSRVFELACTDAGLTHPHPVCRAASGLFGAAIAYAIRTGSAADAVYNHALEFAGSRGVEGPLLECLQQASRSAPADFLTHAGWVLVAFQNAFYQLLHAGNLEEGVVATVGAGGDADTNAAIAGALLGAVHGRDAIPKQWLARVLTCRPIAGLSTVQRPRPACYWPVDALALAERLLIAGQGAAGQ